MLLVLVVVVVVMLVLWWCGGVGSRLSELLKEDLSHASFILE